MADNPMSSNTRFTSATSCYPDSSALPEEVIRSIERALKEGKLLEVVSMLREALQTMSIAPLNVAVAGDSGNGMSSFINALRVMGHEEEGSAPIGVVRTTQTPASYSSSRFPHMVLWDLPGMGTTAQSMENYLDKEKFSHYDFFIIIASEQFSTNHVKLAKTIQVMGKRFYVVWTKLDRDLHTSALSEDQLLQNIRKNIREILQKEGVKEPRIFLISCLDPFLHDFPKLRDALKVDLSDIRHCGPRETLFRTCEKIINDKVSSLKERVATEDIQGMPGIQDPINLEEHRKFYQLLFGVDDESLQQVANSTRKPVGEYMNIMKPQNVQVYNQEGGTLSWIYNIATYIFYTSISYMPYFCNYATDYHRCIQKNLLLETIAQDTKAILRKVLEDSII